LLGTILWETKRLVLQQVTRLHHLKENWLLSSEADLALVLGQDGELVSPLELIPRPMFSQTTRSSTRNP